MKSFSIFLLIIITNVGLAQQPQIARVSSTNITTIYTNLKIAISEAQDDDIIYLSGASFTFDSIGIRKRIHLIGTGHYPDSTLTSGTTNVNGQIYFFQGCGNSSIEGLILNGSFFSHDNDNSIINISKLKINGVFIYSGVQLFNSVINITETIMEGINGQNGISYNVKKSIFTRNGVVYSYGCTPTAIDIENSIIKHCLFLIEGGTYMNLRTSNVTNSIFLNNVQNFQYINAYCPGSLPTTSSFNNNLITNCTVTPILGAQSEVGNLIESSLNNTFVNVTANGFNYAYDYHLKSTSIGNTISGGVGIYAGTASYNPNPINPHIYFKNIPPASNTQGQLQIQFKVKAQ